MTPFFRRIRRKLANDNQFLKYSRYAIGEIVLVVVGILIALSINNWNEERKEKKELENYLIQMKVELSLDIESYDQIIGGNNERIKFLTSVSQGDYSELKIESLPGIITTIIPDLNFGITYNSLRVEGMFNTIDNTQLKNEIATYYDWDCKKYLEWANWHKKFVTETIESYVVLNLPVRSGLLVDSDKLIYEIENGQLLSLINYQLHAFESSSAVMERNRVYAKQLILLIESVIQ